MRDVVVSTATRNKLIHNSTRSGHPTRGLRTLLAHRATLTRDGATVSDGGNKLFARSAMPSLMQVEAFLRLGLKPFDGDSSGTTG